jgi:hypothetical protein
MGAKKSDDYKNGGRSAASPYQSEENEEEEV